MGIYSAQNTLPRKKNHEIPIVSIIIRIYGIINTFILEFCLFLREVLADTSYLAYSFSGPLNKFCSAIKPNERSLLIWINNILIYKRKLKTKFCVFSIQKLNKIEDWFLNKDFLGINLNQFNKSIILKIITIPNTKPLLKRFNKFSLTYCVLI